LNLIRVMPAKGQDISVLIFIRFVQSAAQPAIGSAAAASPRQSLTRQSLTCQVLGYVLETGANQ
jgi:hypothetical protein